MRPDVRLAAPAGVGWVVAGILIACPDVAGWWALTAWSLSVGLGTALLIAALRQKADSSGAPRRHALQGIAAVIVTCSAVGALAASAVWITAPSRQPAALVRGSGISVIDATATVTSATQHRSSSSAFGAGDQSMLTMTVHDVRAHDTDVRGSMPVLVFVETGDPAHANLPIGADVRLRGTMRASPPEDASAFLVTATGVPEVVADPPIWLGWANGLRDTFSTATETLPGDGGALLPGLAIGETSRVDVDLDSAMKLSSLSHLTAVSGANCAVVISLVMVGAAAIGLRRSIRVASALVALTGFVVLVTPGPSVLRAAVMAAIVVFSTAGGRPGRGLPALAFAVIALIALDPWLSRDYGFALSVLATAGLLLVAPALSRTLSRWMPSALAGMIAIPLAAQLACQPVLLLLNPSLPLYGVAANMLAEPAAPVATVLGLVACLLMPIVPGVGYACAQLAWLPSAWIAAVARTAAGLPGSQLPWLGGVAGVAAMALAAVAVMVLSSGVATGSRRILRSLTAVLLLAGIGVYAGTTFGTAAGSRLSMPDAWQVGACDIGQGDAVLVHDGTAHGLVDVGPDPKPLNACLSTLGVDRIDLLVLTHYDQDHVGGLQAVVGRVGTALVGQPTDAHDRSLVESLVSGGADVRIAASGDHGTLGALAWRVLWPTAGGHSMQTGNEGSVTVRFDGDGMSSVFLGDLDEHAQSALLSSGRLQPADLVKVAHHGSADQSERLYQALDARIALISAGLGNDYGHPTARLLGILARAAIPFHRTDLEGIILVVPHTDGSLSVWTERSASAEALRTPGRGG